ncbi:CheR family methyltransferase [Xanthobacter agilis]|uniref:protein-glutamate O-methyltransferase n=1 Tax=Xanthobacter agilis TaxID=47492 RepID=A0ABU0LHY1_XANAG|nr:protein-glutamate O-methyltransferase [Xanthobacter agilis]MDQ0506698.1 chemotaxis protein methyltransferase CheR [Xanthobacter agilis]
MINASDYDFFVRFLKQKSGLQLSDDKHYLLESRLMPLLRKFDVPDFSKLAAMLRDGSSTIIAAAVVEAMTTNETLFFRDKAPFEDFTRTMLPALSAARPPGHRLRIWCAAASSGQEPYSLAILLLENPGLVGRREVEILGTDLSNDVLDRARAGRYNQFEVQRGMGVQMLMKYFTKVGDSWEVKEQVRKMVQFRKFNLLEPFSGMGTFDIVFCRNVLIYFDPPTKTDILARIARVLAPDGYLVLGAAETVIGVGEAFKPLPQHRCTYVPCAASMERRPSPFGIKV